MYFPEHFFSQERDQETFGYFGKYLKVSDREVAVVLS